MSSLLEQLRNKFKKESNENSNSNFYRFWDMPMNESATIRFLPDKNPDNEMGFLQEKMSHTLDINGSNKTVPCLRQYGKACPICELSQSFYKKGDKVSGKKFWISKQHMAQCIVVRDPIVGTEEENSTGKFRLIGLGFQITNIIKEAFKSEELDEVPYAFEGGYDFVIKKTPQGEYPTYSIGTKFKNKPRDLSDEELLIFEEQAIDLSTLLPAEPELETIEALLEAALTGGTYTEEDEDDNNPLIANARNRTAKTSITPRSTAPKDEDDEQPEAAVSTSKTQKSTSAATADDTDDETQAILARIRSGRAKRA